MSAADRLCRAEGIEIAKTQGKYKGRKPTPIDWTKFGQLYGEWKLKNITGRDFMRRMGLSANTFYRRVREYEAIHGIAVPNLLDDTCQLQRRSPTAPPDLAECKTNRQKRKSPQKRLQSVSESLRLILNSI